MVPSLVLRTPVPISISGFSVPELSILTRPGRRAARAGAPTSTRQASTSRVTALQKNAFRLEVPNGLFVHSWQRRRGCFLLIRLGPLNCFAGGGLARQMESTRDKSSTLTHPNCDFDTKVLDKSGFFDICLVPYVMPL
ncbi:hypothetical protein QQZ08_004812 [Neonectria magnoliae]|uniref:Uncharacterized protein n=1 Tax=Neonectria magnoliae TaxID=2732573 RepID=A0ABR1I781_9HYPO